MLGTQFALSLMDPHLPVTPFLKDFRLNPTKPIEVAVVAEVAEAVEVALLLATASEIIEIPEAEAAGEETVTTKIRILEAAHKVMEAAAEAERARLQAT